MIGPSTLLLWRRLARSVIAGGGHPVTIPTTELLATLGLGVGLTKNSVGARTLARLIAFDLARPAGPHRQLLAVRIAVAPVPAHRLERLPDPARRYHRHTTNT